MLKVEFTGQFKKDYKLAVKRGCDPKELEKVITALVYEQPLPEKYRDMYITPERNRIVTVSEFINRSLPVMVSTIRRTMHAKNRTGERTFNAVSGMKFTSTIRNMPIAT